MKIAVLSGKGGTGKTLVAVNLADVATNSVYTDCDVEEPNGHLFFKPTEISYQPVSMSIPTIDNNLCSGCRICVDFCRFNALAFIAGKPVLFEDLCHSCGGCAMLCPKSAITEKQNTIGKVMTGNSQNVTIITGILNTGRASGVPVIREVMRCLNNKTGLAVIDCPPGSACVVMESIKDADYCVLVAEPTIFGLHNLQMVTELVQLFHKPFGVVLNKCTAEANPSESYCKNKKLTILARIPFDKELGEISSNGEIAVRCKPAWHEFFLKLLDIIIKEAGYEADTHNQR